MANKYKSKNGYYKYYNKEGKWCRIKITDPTISGNVIFKMRYPYENYLLPNYYSPNRKFKSAFDIITHICKNLETDGLVVKVLPTIKK